MDAHTSSSCHTYSKSRNVSYLGIKWYGQRQPSKLLQGLHLLVLDHRGLLPLIYTLSGHRRRPQIYVMIYRAGVCIGERLFAMSVGAELIGNTGG